MQLWRKKRDEAAAAKRKRGEPTPAAGAFAANAEPDAPLTETQWRTHNEDLACGCGGCRAYAEAVLDSLLI